MRLARSLGVLMVMGALAGCSSPEERAAEAQERSYDALEEVARERLKLVDQNQECVKDAGGDKPKVEACDSYLKAAEALK